MDSNSRKIFNLLLRRECLIYHSVPKIWRNGMSTPFEIHIKKINNHFEDRLAVVRAFSDTFSEKKIGYEAFYGVSGGAIIAASLGDLLEKPCILRKEEKFYCYPANMFKSGPGNVEGVRTFVAMSKLEVPYVVQLAKWGKQDVAYLKINDRGWLRGSIPSHSKIVLVTCGQSEDEVAVAKEKLESGIHCTIAGEWNMAEYGMPLMLDPKMLLQPLIAVTDSLSSGTKIIHDLEIAANYGIPVKNFSPIYSYEIEEVSERLSCPVTPLLTSTTLYKALEDGPYFRPDQLKKIDDYLRNFGTNLKNLVK